MEKSPYNELIALLNLPKEVVDGELQPLSKKQNLESAGLEDLRQIAAEYLQNTFAELKDELSQK